MATDNQLREAAEVVNKRLKERPGSLIFVFQIHLNEEAAKVRDAIILLATYAAEQLAGDGGLADVKFCESVGIYENIRGPEKGFSGLTCVRVCGAEGSVAVTHWKNHLSPYNILYRPNRQQVRAIAAAFTTTAPKPNGE